MKKLLIAMTAAAVGTCAWAEENAGGSEPTTPAAPVTYLNAATETFANWVNGTDGYVTSVAAPWSYGTVADNDYNDSVVTATDPSADELKVVNGALSLNTGSKALRGAFAADEVEIPNSGLYFSSKVTFKDPSDTLPKLGAKDKFALVVLDNVESIENEVAVTPSTNLFVIAKYGESETRAYELNITIDEVWLARSHDIEVKAYNNVMATGSCAGFLVWVDDKVCKVNYSYAIENEVVNFKYGAHKGGFFEGENQDGIGYLGVEKSAIAPSMLLRYTNKELLLSNYAGDDTLASVDFQGQGTIDDVALKTGATYAEFGTDSLVFTVEGTANGVTITSDTTVYYSAADEKKNITFILAPGWVLKGVAADLTPNDDGVYTYVYTTVAANDQVVKIEAYQPAAYVGNTPYETFSDALKAANGGTLKLMKSVTSADLGESGESGESRVLKVGGNLVLDLNGCTITGSSAEYATIFNYGTLTITNSVGTGIVADSGAGSVLNKGGTLTIQDGKFAGEVKTQGDVNPEDATDVYSAMVAVTGGTFDGAFTVVTPEENAGYTVTASVTGGKFLETANASVAGVATGYEAKLDANGTYWVVAETVIVEEDVFEESKELVDMNGSSATADQINAALEELAEALSATTDKDVAVTNYITKAYGNGKIKADVLLAVGNGTAKNLGISIKYNLPIMTSENAEFSVESSATTGDNVAAFEFSLNDGGNVLNLAEGVLEKALELIQVRADLSSETTWDDATANDVDYAISNGKLKVQLKKNGKGFMKLQAK